MTRDDEKLQEAILRYMEKCGGQEGLLPHRLAGPQESKA